MLSLIFFEKIRTVAQELHSNSVVTNVKVVCMLEQVYDEKKRLEEAKEERKNKRLAAAAAKRLFFFFFFLPICYFVT